MDTVEPASERRPRLLFKSTCPPCRRISNLVVLISLGTIRRVPLDSSEARKVYALFPEHEGEPVLINEQQAIFGWQIFIALPVMIMRVWLRAALYLLRICIDAVVR